MINTTRCHALGFAKRTSKNLGYIEDAFKKDADVHVITQPANSLLGLIVFPWEKHFVDAIEENRLDDLTNKPWPKWTTTKGTSDTLGQLVENLRHFVAHGNMRFSSDSRQLDEVNIEVENYKPRTTTLIWSASISAKDLRKFCVRFIKLIEETIG